MYDPLIRSIGIVEVLHSIFQIGSDFVPLGMIFPARLLMMMDHTQTNKKRNRR